ncbi:cyclin-dependent kinase inhibitor 1B-like [Clarias gariepinus]|uniref:cyclin-dependent kinase inhibitor 1B-like n=1 Tax=Clarias gariepinus TaxID=13013 RepID=UPI00234D9982|nr:cyclin-dependent kinase inhibitor 1B-like [Clarias gariepinus]
MTAFTRNERDVQFSASGVGAARGNFSPRRPRRSVRRSLFGPVDHDELQRDIEEKLREVSENDHHRWNFNFASGTPLLGDYEWEGAAVEATPVFYQVAVRVRKQRANSQQVKPHTQSPNRENCARSDAAKPRAVSCEGTRTGGKPGCPRMKQARAQFTTSPCCVTGFPVKRRKKLGPKSVSEKPLSSLSSEQTPRTRLR